MARHPQYVVPLQEPGERTRARALLAQLRHLRIRASDQHGEVRLHAAAVVTPRVWAAALCVAVVAASVAATGQSRAKALPDPPGTARPARVASPRLAPLPETQWTD